MRKLLCILLNLSIILLLVGCTFDTANFGLNSSNSKGQNQSGSNITSLQQTSGSESSINSSGTSIAGTSSVRSSSTAQTSSTTVKKSGGSTPITDKKEKELKQKMQKLIDDLKISE